MQAVDLLAASERTIMLAPVAGAYALLSAYGLIRRGGADDLVNDLQQHAGLVHAVGAVAFFVGAGILAFDLVWSFPADVALNALAVVWAFEGAGMLATPRLIQKVLSSSTAATGLRYSSAAAAILGIYLLLVAIAGHAR